MAPAVDAGTATSTLSITATVANSCAFSSGSYGPVDFSSLVNTGGNPTVPAISINCTVSAPYTVSAAPGNVGTCLTADVARSVAASTLKIGYFLYLGATGVNVWCDGTSGTSKYTGTGTGSSQAIAYRIFVPGYAADPTNVGGLPYAAGTYTDTITLTASF